MRRREKFLVPLLIVGLSASVMIAPWMIKNAITVGNPFSPFFNKYFPNPYMRISFEEEYVSRHRHYDALKSAWEIPLEVTIRGGMLQGLLGPVFLLLPLSLIALRWPIGRRLVPAALFFAMPFMGNIGTRFLLPSLPFFSLALGLVLSEWRAMAPAVVLFHGLISWPDVVNQYSDGHAWRLDRFRWKQAFRIEPEEKFLERTVASYRAAKLVEKYVPPSGRVFTYGGISQAYSDREILVAYQAGFNNVLGEILVSGFAHHLQPLRHWTYRFKPAPVRRLRLLQTIQADDLWSVTEFRVFSGTAEIPRSKWRLRAWPNPWDVQYAFDNSPSTRWKTFEKAKPGMYLEVDLGESLLIDSVRVEVSEDQPNVKAKLEFETSPGVWTTLDDRADISNVDVPKNMRRMATRMLKHHGVTHVAVLRGEFIYDELHKNTVTWGLTQLGEEGFVTLYRLD